MRAATPATAQTAAGASRRATTTAIVPPVGSVAAIDATIASSATMRTRIARRSGGRMCDRALAIPGDRAREAVAELGPCFEPEQLSRAGDVELPARLAVRHRGVPRDLAREAG